MLESFPGLSFFALELFSNCPKKPVYIRISGTGAKNLHVAFGTICRKDTVNLYKANRKRLRQYSYFLQWQPLHGLSHRADRVQRDDLRQPELSGGESRRWSWWRWGRGRSNGKVLERHILRLLLKPRRVRGSWPGLW